MLQEHSVCRALQYRLLEAGRWLEGRAGWACTLNVFTMVIQLHCWDWDLCFYHDVGVISY